MKKILIAAAFGLAATSVASAADLPARTYSKAPAVYAPVDVWSGFYIGAMGGYGWVGNGAAPFTNVSGGFAGGTVGYNWMMTPNWLLGLEAEGAWADISQSVGADPLIAPFTAGTVKTEAFGSVTGRLGYAFGSALIYAKGGFAFASNKVAFTLAGVTSTDTQTQTGYTIGGGLEYMFAPNWSLKGEYLYANLESKNFTIFGVPQASGDQELHTVKLGVNYHFNMGRPVVAKY